MQKPQRLSAALRQLCKILTARRTQTRQSGLITTNTHPTERLISAVSELTRLMPRAVAQREPTWRGQHKPPATRTHAHTHSRTHAHAHTHTGTHTHTHAGTHILHDISHTYTEGKLNTNDKCCTDPVAIYLKKCVIL